VVFETLGLVILQKEVAKGTTWCRFDVKWAIVAVRIFVLWEPFLRVECLGL
jgi:hypothetical protein